MNLSPEELAAAYALSARPYIEADGPIPAAVLGLKSWRYLIEVNSACNLRCAMCISGNREGYAHTPGVMKMDLLEKVLDKIQSENPNAIVCPYGSGEPMLHPDYASVVAAVKKRGFRCEVATNLHYVEGMDRVLCAHPDMLIVSTSGFTQDIYQRAHRRGDVELLKRNMQWLSDTRAKINPAVWIAVAYHMYNDNLGEEMEKMKALSESLGFTFMISWARTISMENTVQALRFLEEKRTGKVAPYAIGEYGRNWNKLLPPASQDFIKSMERLRFPPVRAVDLYARFPVASVCIIADVFTYIRHDGTVQLCCWTDDARMSLGNYLDMTQDQISAARRGHPLCEACLRYRLPLYYHVVMAPKWDSGGL